MIRWILVLTFIFHSRPSAAQLAVQRTLGSSPKSYQKYLQDTGKSSFADLYLQIAASMDTESPSLEKCLEDLYLGSNFESSCMAAVNSLTNRPLNTDRREILVALLSKLQSSTSPRRQFYSEFRRGLFRTHPDLSKNADIIVSMPAAPPSRVRELEMSAWRKALSRKLSVQEIVLLVNGQRVLSLDQWRAPEGVFQWSLISNTHEPLIRLGSFSQFAADSIQQLKPLADVNCEELRNFEPQKFGILQLEVFSDPKCVADFGLAKTSVQKGHLGTAFAQAEIQKPASASWLIPALFILGAGLAAGLRNKQVTVTWPGSD